MLMSGPVLRVGCLLLASGFCALVFQVTWLREFRLVFGASTPATSAVLAIFMGGLGMGNLLLGRRADASPRPLVYYGRLEVIVGVAAALSPWLIDLVRGAYVALGGQESLGAAGATFVRLIFSSLVLAVPTLAMGGTLAAAARAVTGHEDASRRGVGVLYALNTFGAVLGTVLATFLLLEVLGSRATLWSAAAVNIAVGVVAWQVGLRLPPRQRANGPQPAARRSGDEAAALQPEKTADSPRRNRHGESPQPPAGSLPARQELDAGLFLYTAAAIVGFVFFLMELVWYRMLAPILGGTTFTFGLILAVALAGIGLGAALYPWLFRRRTCALADLALSCSAEALAIAIPFALGDQLAIFSAVLRDMTWFGFTGQVIGWSIVAVIVVFPAAVISGIQFPLLIGLLGQGGHQVGRHVGLAYALNTLGAIAGALAGGFGLVPLLTAPGSWILSVVTLVGLAGGAAFAAYRQQRRLLATVPAALPAAAALACLLAVGPTAAWRHSGLGAGRAQLPGPTPNELRDWVNKYRRMTHWQVDGRESSVALSASDSYSFYINGKSDGNARLDASTQVMLGMLGAILHPDPRSALVVGLGSGETAGWLAASPGMERVDVVELEPAMAEVARRCAPLNHDVLSRPNVRMIYSDAREVLLATPHSYDLIVSEPSNPYRAGIAGLYTREFYQAARRRLRKHGLFVQWLQAYEIDAGSVRIVLGTLHDAFGHVEIWRSASTDLLLVCSQEPPTHDAARLRPRIAQPHFQAALKLAWHTDSLDGVFGFYVANAAFVRELARRERHRNTDDRNLLEYGFARSVGQTFNFSVERILAAAQAERLHRPSLAGGDIDWDRADAERRAFLILNYESVLLDVVPPQTAGQQKRAEPLYLVAAGDSAGAVAHWRDVSLEELSPGELLLLAAASVDIADPRAEEVLRRLGEFDPLEAEALTAVLRQRQGRTQEAAQTLYALLVALRSDPTPHLFAIRPCFPMAVQLARSRPSLAPMLGDALGQPLSVMICEELRLGAIGDLAALLPPEFAVHALALFEPHVPWNEGFLAVRARIYRQMRHPLAETAERELAEFRRHSPPQEVLRETGE